METIDAYLLQTQDPFLHSMLFALEARSEDYLKTERRFLFEHRALWSLLDSHLIAFCELDSKVVTMLPSFVRAVIQMRDCATKTLRDWEEAKGTGIRKTHEEVVEIEKARMVCDRVPKLLRCWGVE